MSHVIGLDVKRRQLVVEPLIKLNAAEAFAECLVSRFGLYQRRFSVSEL